MNYFTPQTTLRDSSIPGRLLALYGRPAVSRSGESARVSLGCWAAVPARRSNELFRVGHGGEPPELDAIVLIRRASSTQEFRRGKCAYACRALPASFRVRS